MCEGLSQEEMLAEHAEIIAEHGYLVTGVGDGDPPHWTYTVGLLDLVGHPELDVVQVFAPRAEICGCELCRQPDLSRPESRVGVAPLTPRRRAVRRR
jgi:hypothetical protein